MQPFFGIIALQWNESDLFLLCMHPVSSWPVIPTKALWKRLSLQKLQENPWAADCLPQTTQWNRINPIQEHLVHVKGERCFTGLPCELVLEILHCGTTS